jgi:Spy/CpxP family protein refolding chaperone
MRTIRNSILLSLVVLTAGITAFATTLSLRTAQHSEPPQRLPDEVVMDWLSIPQEQRSAIREHDPSFSDDLNALRADVAEARSALVAALETGDLSDDQIRQRVESVITASAALERRVIDHLLSVRQHLTPEQQRQVFSLCAEGVRQGPGWRWRQGQDDAFEPGRGGRGPRPGRGPGSRRLDP